MLCRRLCLPSLCNRHFLEDSNIECRSTGLYGAIKADLKQRSSSSTRKTGATCTQLWIEWLPQRVPSNGERLYTFDILWLGHRHIFPKHLTGSSWPTGTSRNSLNFSLWYLSTCAWGHTHNLFFSPAHAREFLRLAPCAHLFGRYAVYRSLLRVLWAWFDAQRMSITFCSFSHL